MKTLMTKQTIMRVMLVLAISSFSVANAQKTSKYKKKSGPEVKFGITAGADYSIQSGYKSLVPKGVVGFSGGVYTKYSFSDDFKLKLSALYNQWGSDFVINQKDYNERETYISMPFNVQAYFGKRFYVNVGPQINFLMAATINGEDMKSDLKPMNFGANGGFGFYITDHFGIELLAYYGLNEIYKDYSSKIIFNTASAKIFYEF